MKFSDKVRRTTDYPTIKVIEGKEYSGIDAVFFTRQGGVSEDEYQGESLVGAYAGLNVGSITRDKSENIVENLRRAADFTGSQPEKLILLEPKYTDGVHIVNSNTPRDRNPLGVHAVMQGDALITDDPEMAIACVSGDAHPIVIKARKEDGAPVAAVVLASHQAMLRGIVNKTLKRMVTEFDIASESVEIEIGAGLGPSSTERASEEQLQHYSSTSYEIGIGVAQDYLAAGAEQKAGYESEGVRYFSSDSFKYINPEDAAYFDHSSQPEERDQRAPIFTPHPTNRAKCMLDIEALVKQTAAIPMDIHGRHFSGVAEERVSAVNRDIYKEADNFFSARRQVKDLNLSAVDAIEGEATNLARYKHIGRNLVLVRLFNTLSHGEDKERGM